MASVREQVWIVLTDGQDRKYYWKPETNQTSWELPAAEGVVLWMAQRTADGKTYYWNQSTRKTTWDVPTAAQRTSSSPLAWGTPSSSSSAPADWPFRAAHRGQSVPSAPGTSHGGEQADIAEFAPGNPQDDHPSDSSAWVEVPVPGAGQRQFYYWDYLHGSIVESLPRGVRARWRACRGTEGWWYYYCVDSRVCYESLPGMLTDCREENFESCKASMSPRWLEIDAAVSIHGLRNRDATRYNGQTGKVFRHGDGRVVVRLGDMLGGTLLALRPRNLMPLAKASIVTLNGLSQASLNGEVAVVEDVNHTDVRLDVKMRDGSLKAVKPTRVLPSLRLWNISLTQVQEWLQWRKEQNCLFIDSTGQHRSYSLHLPLNFTMSAKEGGKFVRPWPVMVYMHGTGGSSFFTNSKKSLKSNGLQYAASKFIIVSPKCDWTWKEVPKPWVNELVEALRPAQWVDDNRIYITGCSMGGMSTWEIASARPELYAAIAPVAGHHQEERERLIADQLQRTPTFVVHSECDDTCPFRLEERLWGLLQANPRLEVHLSPDIDHCSMFERTYCDETLLYDWLLKFERA